MTGTIPPHHQAQKTGSAYLGNSTSFFLVCGVSSTPIPSAIRYSPFNSTGVI
jgi:hypothetical protein